MTNVSGRNYADYIVEAFMKPLGMSSTSYDIARAPAGRRAIGYRWEGGEWIEEPALGSGVFGAMGGLTTTGSASGDVLAAPEALAMNLLLDQGVALRNAQIAGLKRTLGACRAADPIRTDSAMSATITFPCERGTLRVRILLAPTTPSSLQSLEFLE